MQRLIFIYSCKFVSINFGGIESIIKDFVGEFSSAFTTNVPGRDNQTLKQLIKSVAIILVFKLHRMVF